MLIAFFQEVYGAFNLDDVRLELSTRPEKSIGSDEIWEKAEEALKSALRMPGLITNSMLEMVLSMVLRSTFISEILSSVRGSVVRFSSTSRCQSALA